MVSQSTQSRKESTRKAHDENDDPETDTTTDSDSESYDYTEDEWIWGEDRQSGGG